MAKHFDRAEIFSKSMLLQTFNFLREEYPGLALEIRNLTALSQDDNKNAFELALTPEKVSEIVIALSSIAEINAISANSNREQLIDLHGTLLDWLTYAQSFMHKIDIINSSDSK